MYHLIILPEAENDFERLDRTIARRIRRKLDRLCATCDTHRHEALRGKDRGRFRLRVQDYRAVYSFNKGTREITIHRIDHRSKVYS